MMPSLNQKSEFFSVCVCEKQREGGREGEAERKQVYPIGQRQHLLSPQDRPDGLTSLLDRIPTTLYPEDHGFLDQDQDLPRVDRS